MAAHLRGQDALYPLGQIANDLGADLVGDVVLMVFGGVAFGFQKIPGTASAVRVVSEAVCDEYGLVTLVGKPVTQCVRVLDRAAQGRQPSESVGAGQAVAVSQAAALREASEQGASRCRLVSLRNLLNKVLHLLLYASRLFAKAVGGLVGISWRSPGVAKVPRADEDRDGCVGANVEVAPGVYLRCEAGKVIHVGTEPVQKYDQRVTSRIVIPIGVDGEIDQASARLRLGLHAYTYTPSGALIDALMDMGLCHVIITPPEAKQKCRGSREGPSLQARHAPATVGQFSSKLDDNCGCQAVRLYSEEQALQGIERM